MGCWACSIDRHSECQDTDDDVIDPDGDGWYEVTCCCGAWGETHQTLDAEYAQSNRQLKPLQWPDAPRAGDESR